MVNNSLSKVFQYNNTKCLQSLPTSDLQQVLYLRPDFFFLFFFHPHIFTDTHSIAVSFYYASKGTGHMDRHTRLKAQKHICVRTTQSPLFEQKEVGFMQAQSKFRRLSGPLQCWSQRATKARTKEYLAEQLIAVTVRTLLKCSRKHGSSWS